MSKKPVKYKHIILLKSRRERYVSEVADPQSLGHEVLPRCRAEHSSTKIPNQVGSVQGTARSSSKIVPEESPPPLAWRRLVAQDRDASLPPYAKRRWRGWIISYFSGKRAQRIIPMKSTSFRLRCRNLSYKRKWNLGWC